MQKIQFYSINVVSSAVALYAAITAVTAVINYIALPTLIICLIILAVNNKWIQ